MRSSHFLGEKTVKWRDVKGVQGQLGLRYWSACLITRIGVGSSRGPVDFMTLNASALYSSNATRHLTKRLFVSMWGQRSTRVCAYFFKSAPVAQSVRLSKRWYFGNKNELASEIRSFLFLTFLRNFFSEGRTKTNQDSLCLVVTVGDNQRPLR